MPGNMDIRQRALIARERDIESVCIVLDCRCAEDGDPQIVCFHHDAVFLAPDDNRTVHSLLILVLPGVPALKIPGMINVYDVFGMGIGFPVLPVQTTTSCSKAAK